MLIMDRGVLYVVSGPKRETPRSKRAVRVHDDGRPRKLVVFTDVEATRVAAVNGLMQAGYEVEHASNPIGCSGLCLRTRASAAVIDMSMSGLPGAKFIQVLRSNPRLSGMGLVLLCGEAEFDVQHAAHAALPHTVVLSAQMLDSLLPTIDRLIESIARDTPTTPVKLPKRGSDKRSSRG